MSTTEAELISLAHSAREDTCFSNLLYELYLEFNNFQISGDNRQSLLIAASSISRTTKHMVRRHHYLKELVAEGRIMCVYFQRNKRGGSMHKVSLSKGISRSSWI